MISQIAGIGGAALEVWKMVVGHCIGGEMDRIGVITECLLLVHDDPHEINNFLVPVQPQC